MVIYCLQAFLWEPYATHVKLFKDPRMSMLAEPRRKQKWSVDPRNSTWSKDESKFGQKMLERMGWSKGKGLGRTEQGTTDHIKVKVKNNNYGLGTSVSCEDNWIAHQDDFNELLAQLNNCHGQNSSTEPPPPEEPKGFSLEEKSKTSKKRVHYMKFTKGKDLSSRSETDLNCIFGKRGRSAIHQEQENNSSDSQGETEETFTPAAFKLDTETITNTVKSTLTMQEYFAQRMAQLKKSRGQAQSTAPSMETDETSGPSEEQSPSEEPSANLISNDDSEEPKKKKKKKKKKKSKKSADDLEVVEENSTAAPIVVIEDDEDQQQERSGKKKKKRKMVESEGAANENCSSTSGAEQNCEELPPSKKKKKKLEKQNKETELLHGHGPTEDQTVESEVVDKKKKKRREEMDDVVKEEEPVEKKSKKDKKKKKKHQE
ncbi:PIN2/TERF1-interacting telomerase inhibitor 1 [Sebastes umbrosus]|uniref:PIN2/TERF1-interacting telomerase inhibitor 1 n=1 Tax=Sebastes umbrosus TaxID=72105 RepID=UPI0018A0479B|nr:PIN2/TERF1-interacting telomerase inhibitor 1 [Sebastes umbrosus]